MPFARNTLALLAATSALALAGQAQAALVYINSSQTTINSTLSSAGSARYLLSHGNYDQNIHNGVGSVSGSTIVSSQLGNVHALSNRTFNFLLENRAGEGLIFNLTAPASGNLPAINSTLAWGTFSPTLTGEVPAIGGVNPGSAFNVISLWARADRASTSMTFSDLVFSSPDVAIADGQFYAGTASRNSANLPTGSLVSPGAPPIAAFSSYTQNIVSAANLASVDWSLTGKITGLRDANSAGEASVAFQISLTNASVGAPEVPEPSSAALVMMTAIPLLLRRKR